MKPYPNRIARFVLLLSIVVGLMACKPNPQDDISLFQPFITENINKKSADPYISSTVKPGDKMYDILVNIQHGDTKPAYEKLMVLVDKNDYEAQFWVAKMIYQASSQSIARAINLYKQSSNQGNPYAYYELSPLGKGCLAYFGKKTCTDENLNKAIELFKPLAAQGDLRAQYFLLQQQELDKSKETRAQYIHELIRFSKNHYYQPLMDYVNTILTRPQGKFKYEAKTPELYQLAIQLLTVAANNNYIPAIEFLVRQDSDLKSNDDLYLKLKTLGGTHFYKTRFFEFKNEFNNRQLYCYATLYEAITGSDKFFIGIENEENIAADCNIEDSMKEMTPMVYIDGFTSRDDWVD
ncbi:tetratricopeptide repeat protein [Vibrio cholerae]|uniref:Sel1 repeat family protein n=2 Tax=Vibrio cholerae TaxID=666 RepID=A0A6B3LB00_VIBCL|nr:sel1 repeat family protein [Vibrio cholerae]EGR0377292.1 sel1 repeat family protein [Vibrio cholerae]EGR0516272.1 sel1 repeat family protein [Vibrio cholerae]EGR0545235.1 sel1 repeat family protein [Vibrio cholerae]EGR0569440.1 sel1 repeat family protein [Vibrio cholerae]EGR0572688.1 sel1 repeat family protein [Vibrio cholerae]